MWCLASEKVYWSPWRGNSIVNAGMTNLLTLCGKLQNDAHKMVEIWIKRGKTFFCSLLIISLLKYFTLRSDLCSIYIYPWFPSRPKFLSSVLNRNHLNTKQQWLLRSHSVDAGEDRTKQAWTFSIITIYIYNSNVDGWTFVNNCHFSMLHKQSVFMAYTCHVSVCLVLYVLYVCCA